MRRIMILLCLALSTSAIAEDVRTVSRAAYDAYQAKDWVVYLEKAKRLDALRPDHPRVLYNLSGALALNGEKGEAIETLSRVAAMGIVYAAEKDSDFDSIRDDPRFAAILETFERNARDVGNATIAFTLPDVRGAVPEGLARDPRSGSAWVSLVRDRAILHVAPDGSFSKLEIPGDIWSVTGIRFDPASGTLWFATAATPMMREPDEAAAGRSAIVAWSVAESKVVGRWDLDNADAPHWLGDLTLSGDGTVYATDSMTPAIYRIAKGSDAIEKWVTNDGFVSLQGLTLSENGRRLYVADYTKGIWSVDPDSGSATLLPAPSGATVLGIDGLYRHGGDLIAIQNGTNPHRIVRVHLDNAGARIKRVETLEANRPQFDEPTLGLVENGSFWFVATSQWGSFTDDGKLKEGAEEKPVVVMKRKL